MSCPIRNQKTSVGEILKAAEEFQRLSGNIRIRQFPNRLSFSGYFYQTGISVLICYGNQRMSVRQAGQRMRTAGNIQLPHDFTVRIIFLHTLISIMCHEKMSVIQPAGIAHKGESAIFHAFRQNADFLHNLPLRRYLQHPSGHTFTDKCIAVLQTLTGKNRTLGLIMKDGIVLTSHFEYSMSGGEKDIAIRQYP